MPIRTREGVILMTQDTTNTSLTVSRDGGKTWTFTPITDKKWRIAAEAPRAMPAFTRPSCSLPMAV